MNKNYKKVIKEKSAVNEINPKEITIDKIVNTYKNRIPQPIGNHKYYSILIPFVEKEGKLNLLYELRSYRMKSQPGEVCFPGGRVEKGEGPMAAALRETTEELGIPSEKIKVLGRGDILYGYANYTIFTYIGQIEYQDYLNLKISEDEVEETFLIPIERLMEKPPEEYVEKVIAQIEEGFPYDKIGVDQKYPWRSGTWHIPIYEIDNKVIWGLTARITEVTLDNVLKT